MKDAVEMAGWRARNEQLVCGLAEPRGKVVEADPAEDTGALVVD